MPTYEYECSKCGHKFDAFHSMTSKNLKTCPKCKKPALQRLIGSGSGVIFKGSGFYANDYKKKSKDSSKDSCPAKKDKPCDSCPINKDK